jgi:hypothetical protein
MSNFVRMSSNVTSWCVTVGILSSNDTAVILIELPCPRSTPLLPRAWARHRRPPLAWAPPPGKPHCTATSTQHSPNAPRRCCAWFSFLPGRSHVSSPPSLNFSPRIPRSPSCTLNWEESSSTHAAYASISTSRVAHNFKHGYGGVSQHRHGARVAVGGDAGREPVANGFVSLTTRAHLMISLLLETIEMIRMMYGTPRTWWRV